MSQTLPFNEVVEAADGLSPEEQVELVAILQRRLAEAGRRRVAAEVAEARREFAAGNCAAMSPPELIQEMLK